MNASEPREDAVAGHVAVLEMYMRERCEHPEDEPAFRAAIAALAQQGAEPVAWRCSNSGDVWALRKTKPTGWRHIQPLYAPATGAPR